MTSWDAIPAGPELDRVVAETLMRIPICSLRVVDWSISGILNSWNCPEHGTTGCISPESMPAYSKTIDAAWLVVSHWQRTGWNMSMYWEQRYGTWVVELWTPEWHGGVGARAESAPEAICRVALQTIRKPSEEE
jgi:Phage ABA sandwich domain